MRGIHSLRKSGADAGLTALCRLEVLAAALPFVASQDVPRWALLLARKDVKDDPAVNAQDAQAVDALSWAPALISADPGSPSFLQASREFQVRLSEGLAQSGILA